MKPLVLLCLWSCGASPEPAQPQASQPHPEPVEITSADEVVGIHTGVQHPPIPADSPAWRHDPGGFVPDVRFYGERTWDDVRMRVAGHIGVIERDRARLLAQAGQYSEAAKTYSRLAADMDRLMGTDSGPSRQIPTLIRDAAVRDAALLNTVAASKSLQDRLTPQVLWSELLSDRKIDETQVDIAAFKDFDDRHAMRVSLWSLYLESADPIGIDSPWGYFDASAHGDLISLRQAQREGRCTDWNCRWESEAASAVFDLEGTGGMPTGDSLIDVAGEPGPQSIGRLEKLGLDDARHRQWVEDTVYVFNKKLKESPGALVSLIKSRVDQLNHFKHGSKYYNIKQLKNEGVRVLAQGGHYDLARQVLAMNFPLHHQDWECPNRQGTLLAIDARLAALDRDKHAAENLKKARSITDAFLAKVAEADSQTRP